MGTCIAQIICSSIHTGTFPVVALMVGNAITRLTNDLPECMTNSTLMEGIMDNSTDDPCALSDCDSLRVEIAVTISLMVGILMVRGIKRL